MLPTLTPVALVQAPVHYENGITNAPQKLAEVLARAWSPFTSAYITCESPNLAWGQSDVTALAVQEALGGEIVRTTFTLPDGKQGAHFFNLLPDGSRMDVTLPQYKGQASFSPPLDASDDVLRSATVRYLRQHGTGALSLKDHLLALPDNEANADTRGLSGILSDDPPSERYAILQHNIGRAQSGRIGRG